MRGYVTKKGKKYYAVIYDGIDPATGKEKRRWVAAGSRRDDADKLVTELTKRSHRGETVVSEKLTLGQYLTTRWLPVQETRLRASTYDSYRRNIDLHVIPALGERLLDRLTAEDIDLFYASLLKNGSKRTSKTPDGEQAEPKGLAPKTVHNIHVMLNKALSDAARKGTVVRNVVAMADAPSLQARKRAEIKAWDVDQLVAFLDAIAPHRLSPAFFLAAHTGMRRGEVLGLRWRDLDLDANRVAVRQALVSVAYEVSISDVKTGTSRRTIDIDADVVQMLSDWFKTRTEERDGTEPAADDLVFTKDDGSWLHPDTFSQLFDRTVARIKVPVISLHDLRHTHATLLLKAGVHVKVVSERLGHANVAFTMNVYQHILPGMQAAAADTFSLLLRNQRNKTASEAEAEAETDADDTIDADDSTVEDDQ
ncbi:MAG: site-specific integrase [Microthrixaceae bacterium]|nr:site-specific integrase [Microthrixaceae bacterium]MCB1010654.1 site-specific integrase [Microthrixaceae bacterium]MCO5307162.1 site-specific integrase [Microthrixaceae bacterium]